MDRGVWQATVRGVAKHSTAQACLSHGIAPRTVPRVGEHRAGAECLCLTHS